MARHIERGWGRPWSGTPDDLVKLANEGQRIFQAAAGEECNCSLTLDFSRRRRISYDSPEEFLAEFKASDTSDLKGIMIYYSLRDNSIAATVHLVRGLGERPFVTVTGDESSLVSGLANRLSGIFRGRRLSWQGIRRAGEVPRLKRIRMRVGTLAMLVVTVAITAVVTIVVTKLLD